MPQPLSTRLIPHPDCTPAPVDVLEAEVRLAGGGGLIVVYRLAGDLERLAIPAPLPAGPADGLWNHTCFEAFVAVGDGPGYREFNFSPSGQWAAYGFHGYRRRDEGFRAPVPPRISLSRRGRILELEATVSAELLPPDPAGAGLRLGLTAVVEAADGGKSYWALAHPGAKPDFHLSDAFTLSLAPLGLKP